MTSHHKGSIDNETLKRASIDNDAVNKEQKKLKEKIHDQKKDIIKLQKELKKCM